jgi:hypothetical protein
MSLLLLLGWFFAGDVARLNAEEWADREDAQARLKSAGLAAVPALRRGLVSESPEVRHRCTELLATWRKLAWDMEAIGVLMAPDLPDADGYWTNLTLRKHVQRIGEANGCVYCDPCPFFSNGIVPPVAEQSLEEANWILFTFRLQLEARR